jgi:hypothetical protein
MVGLGAILIDAVVPFSIGDGIGSVLEQECTVVEDQSHDVCGEIRGGGYLSLLGRESETLSDMTYRWEEHWQHRMI